LAGDRVTHFDTRPIQVVQRHKGVAMWMPDYVSNMLEVAEERDRLVHVQRRKTFARGTHRYSIAEVSSLACRFLFDELLLGMALDRAADDSENHEHL
jgi:hypothetical protein